MGLPRGGSTNQCVQVMGRPSLEALLEAIEDTLRNCLLGKTPGASTFENQRAWETLTRVPALCILNTQHSTLTSPTHHSRVEAWGVWSKLTDVGARKSPFLSLSLSLSLFKCLTHSLKHTHTHTHTHTHKFEHTNTLSLSSQQCGNQRAVFNPHLLCGTSVVSDFAMPGM